MKVISWNCNGAFRKKYKAIAEYDPDICVIQECERPDQVQDREFTEWGSNHLWTGKDQHRGLGVFAANGISLEQLDWPTQGLEFLLPCRIDSSFNFVGIWACRGSNQTRGYIGHVWSFLQLNWDRIREGEVLLAGDLNSNTIWDKKRREDNHSDVVRLLDEVGINSLYHSENSVPHGSEADPTFYLYRNPQKPYHIDYIFGSAEFQDSFVSLHIGDSSRWLQMSDHLPLVAEFETEELRRRTKTVTT